MRQQGAPDQGRYPDRATIGRFVEHVMEQVFFSFSEMDRRTGIGRSTLYRIRDGAENVSEKMYRRTERALELPPGSLEAVGAHDAVRLELLGALPEHVLWLRSQTQTDITGTA